MIGLKRNVVRVVTHEQTWAALYEAEAEMVRKHIGDIVADIQHVGSTSVLELSAKPILDIAVSVNTVEKIQPIIEKLTRFGYLNCGNKENQGGYLLVKESEPNIRTIHMHIVEKNDPQWINYIKPSSI
ncbi:GrpB family protein [Evansella halocellulosilytica]|uniref:GrpB family protein n=1 Tax=Evansella halocellulosilytica TaxID=2011013 RepID=UPI000BB8A14E|nr:GrpB family protein [Evansella halocellulosilytica]